MSTREMNTNALGAFGEPQIAEHSPVGRSKRVTPGAIPFATDPASPKTVDPINLTLSVASASTPIMPRKSYLLTATVDCWFRMSAGASAALVTDIYLPAKTSIVVWSGDFTVFSAIAGGAGQLQLVELG